MTGAGDAFHTAAGALDAYASTLVWAQQQAAAAISLWSQGQAATRQAMAQHTRRRCSR
jgi:Putative T7SS secretion signal domain